MQSLAEWKFGSGNVRDKKKKQKVDYEPHRPTAARLINKYRRSKLLKCLKNKSITMKDKQWKTLAVSLISVTLKPFLDENC